MQEDTSDYRVASKGQAPSKPQVIYVPIPRSVLSLFLRTASDYIERNGHRTDILHIDPNVFEEINRFVADESKRDLNAPVNRGVIK